MHAVGSASQESRGEHFHHDRSRTGKSVGQSSSQESQHRSPAVAKMHSEFRSANPWPSTVPKSIIAVSKVRIRGPQPSEVLMHAVGGLVQDILRSPVEANDSSEVPS